VSLGPLGAQEVNAESSMSGVSRTGLTRLRSGAPEAAVTLDTTAGADQGTGVCKATCVLRAALHLTAEVTGTGDGAGDQGDALRVVAAGRAGAGALGENALIAACVACLQRAWGRARAALGGAFLRNAARVAAERRGVGDAQGVLDRTLGHAARVVGGAGGSTSHQGNARIIGRTGVAGCEALIGDASVAVRVAHLDRALRWRSLARYAAVLIHAAAVSHERIRVADAAGIRRTAAHQAALIVGCASGRAGD